MEENETDGAWIQLPALVAAPC